MPCSKKKTKNGEDKTENKGQKDAEPVCTDYDCCATRQWRKTNDPYGPNSQAPLKGDPKLDIA